MLKGIVVGEVEKVPFDTPRLASMVSLAVGLGCFASEKNQLLRLYTICVPVNARINPVALEALKEALSKVYWFKSELQSFLRNSIGDPAILQIGDWGGYKIQVVSDIVDHLASDQERYFGHLRRLISDVIQFRDFPHLERLDDGEQKAERARVAVEILRKLVEDHEQTKRERETAEAQRRREAERMSKSKALLSRLEDSKCRFISLVTSVNHQARGIELEKILYDIFDLFDLDPRASFKLTGEQIDGAFSLDGTDYLLEAKWQQEAISRADMDVFKSKVERKLDNTLGLFLGINGFSRDGIDIHSSGRPLFLAMTGADLMAVLEGRIDFRSLLQRKRRHAAHSGKILLEVHELGSE